MVNLKEKLNEKLVKSDGYLKDKNSKIKS